MSASYLAHSIDLKLSELDVLLDNQTRKEHHVKLEINSQTTLEDLQDHMDMLGIHSLNPTSPSYTGLWKVDASVDHYSVPFAATGRTLLEALENLVNHVAKSICWNDKFGEKDCHCNKCVQPTDDNVVQDHVSSEVSTCMEDSPYWDQGKVGR